MHNNKDTYLTTYLRTKEYSLTIRQRKKLFDYMEPQKVYDITTLTVPRYVELRNKLASKHKLEKLRTQTELPDEH